MRKDTLAGTMTVAAVLCIVCTLFVSAASVKLRPLQKKNKLLDLKKNILNAAGMYKDGINIDVAFKKIEAKLVNLEDGSYVDGNPATFDQKKSSKNPETSIRIAGEDDIADIKRRSKVAPVYIVKNEGGETQSVIVPMHGLGLWSIMYGFIALDKDLNTITGITFYQHGETPGLGGEIDNPKWRALWPGKLLKDDTGKLMIEVIKGVVPENSPIKQHQVDGMAGATITSRGVSNLVKYWLGKNAFGPYLQKLAEGMN